MLSDLESNVFMYIFVVILSIHEAWIYSTENVFIELLFHFWEILAGGLEYMSEIAGTLSEGCKEGGVSGGGSIQGV